MTRPEPFPSAPRVLVIYFSHSGDTRTAIERVTSALSVAGAKVDVIELELTNRCPFPWKLKDFLEMLPSTVMEQPAALTPLENVTGSDHDWIILGWQVWFLHPSQPVRTFLRSAQGSVLDRRRVITIGTCRHMWQEALLDLGRDLSERRARCEAHYIALHDRSGLLSFVTTPFFLLTGKSTLTKTSRLNPDVLDAISVDVVRRIVGTEASPPADADISADGTPRPDPNFIIAERCGIAFMRFWARLAERAGAPKSLYRKMVLLAFITTLAVLVPAALVVSFSGRWLWQAVHPASLKARTERFRDF